MSDETTIEKTQLVTERSRSLPVGWEKKTLGEVCVINPKKSEVKDLPANHLVSFLPMKDLGIAQNQINPITIKQLSEVKGSYTYFRNNDILLAKVTPCFENGKLGIARGLKNEIGFGSSEYIVFRPKHNILSEYVFYILASDKFRNRGKELMYGAVGLKRLSKDYVQNFPLSLPPLPQQKQIVVTLDKAFAAIDTAKANAEQNLQNAKELFESISLQKFTVGINIKKWELEKIEKYSQVVVGYVGPISKEYTNDENDVLLLSTKNISDEGISLKKLTRINHTFHNKQKKSQLFPGDILVARHGKSGQSAVIPDSMKVAHALNVIIIKKSETILSEYIAFLLNSGVLSKIQDSKGGSVQEIINTSVIKNLIIPVPSLLNQGKIIEELNNVSKQAKKLESIYTQKIADLEEMKKSILQKAFSGELS